MEQFDLIRQARGGDQAAWVNIVRRHQEPVFRLAYLRLGDADAAEDVTQETFIRAYRALSGFDPAHPLRPWLLHIALNLARNRQRALGRYLSALRRWALEVPVESPGLEDAAAVRGEALELWQAVKRLPALDQEVIYLRYFLDMPVEQAATALSVRPGTVKSRTHRALKRLRAVIERDFPALAEDRTP